MDENYLSKNTPKIKNNIKILKQICKRKDIIYKSKIICIQKKNILDFTKDILKQKRKVGATSSRPQLQKIFVPMKKIIIYESKLI